MTKFEKGTGLGLSQIYGFIQRSNGAIKVISELGKGSDPKTVPARIRAMYTHPNWGRNGVGSYLINLGATTAGEALYLIKGYREIEREVIIAENGEENIIIKMTKSLGSSADEKHSIYS